MRFLCVALLLLSSPLVYAVPISLNDFFADPTVDVAADGNSATFTEDDTFGVAALVNDPSFGDPNVIVPSPGAILSFQFDFELGSASDADEFFAFILDVATGLPVGPAFEFFTASSESGSVEFDLSPLVGKTLGLQFQLTSILGQDQGRGSTLEISQVDLSVASVPEPQTLVLLLLGLMGSLVIRRKMAC